MLPIPIPQWSKAMAIFELATADWLAKNIEQGDVVLIDTRPAAEYWSGHIPGARHIDPSLFAIPRTDAPSLARLHAILAWSLSALGVSQHARVVIAGAQNDTNAARVAWALAYAGVRRIALLDGGVDAWPGERVIAAPAVTATAYTLDLQASYLATAQEVLAATQGSGARVIDARTKEEYTGQRSNAGRTGRVPGARFWDASRELAADGRYAAAAQLAPAVKDIVAADERAIVYCGGGGRAARTFIALQLAGHTGTAVYPASWNEWGTSDQYPVETAAA
jgi:thiosulfate/3-mercaptopyruvate sulfurtransferase